MRHKKLSAVGTIDRDQTQLAAQLYQHFAQPLFLYLYKQTRSREESEDLLVETFLAAMEHTKFAEMSSQYQQSWLWAVARNKLIDQLRFSQRRPQVPLHEFVDYFIDENQSPEQLTILREEYACLYTHLQELTPLQRRILTLRYQHELTCGKIAQMLNKSEGSVRMIICRTIKLLRHRYSKQIAS